MKLCDCGCGLPAPIASTSHAARGKVKGQPLRFRYGHYKTIMLVPGQRFGRWTVEAEAARRKQARMVTVRCDCGQVRGVALATLRSGRSTCCGCGYGTHGHSGRAAGRRSPTYRSWSQMRQRCTNPRHHAWADYGGRGIGVCAVWLTSFERFLADMGPRPSLLHTLDRFPNNDGHYEPGNCRWATKAEQRLNRRPTSSAQRAQLERARLAQRKKKKQVVQS